MSHSPKIRALIAAAEGRLSAAGQARLTRHVEGCNACRRAQSAQQRYDTLRTAAHHEEPPALRWEALEAAIDAEPQSAAAQGVADVDSQPADVLPLRSQRPVWLVGALAAAAALALSLLPSEPPAQPERAQPSAPQVATVAPARRRLGQLSLVAGDVQIAQGAGPFEPAQLHAELRPGTRLRTGAASAAHATLADGSAIALEAGTDLALPSLDGDHVDITLASGSVRNAVAHLARSESYEVHTRSGFTARVRGTRFVVTTSSDDTGVSVSEGVVQVLDHEKLVAELHAGDSFAAHHAPEPAARFEPPHAPELEPPQLGGVVLPRLSQAQAYVVAEHAYPAREGLAVRAPLGSTLALGVVDARGVMRTLNVPVSARLTPVSRERLLALLGLGARGEAAAQELGPEAVRSVVRGGILALRRCYERSLRSHPDLSARVLLRLQVLPSGRVGQAIIAEQRERARGGLPDDLSACVVKTVRAWTFPAPGGSEPVDLEVPIHLRSLDGLLK
jgi:FecR protein